MRDSNVVALSLRIGDGRSKDVVFGYTRCFSEE